LGFEDETWWSRVARPALHAWTPAPQPLRLVEQPVPPTEPDPEALACYGLLLQERTPQEVRREHVRLRFVADRPVGGVTVALLTWVCTKSATLGKTALVVVWENASWHRSHAVRQWLREHNRQVNREGQGLRIVSGPLPSNSPWLTPSEAHWLHGKRAVIEPARLLTAAEVVERVNTHFGWPSEEPLSIPQKVS
jgi:hypothetical protein